MCSRALTETATDTVKGETGWSRDGGGPIEHAVKAGI